MPHVNDRHNTSRILPYLRLDRAAIPVLCGDRVEAGFLRLSQRAGTTGRAGPECSLLGREQEITQRLLVGGDHATDDVVRAYTCSWIALQGAVAAAIIRLHPDVDTWLACR